MLTEPHPDEEALSPAVAAPGLAPPRSRPAPRVAVVGATGAVGAELIACLEARAFPLASLRLFASARSAGRRVRFRGAELVIEELTDESFDGIDIALFSAGATISRHYAPLAAEAGAVVIDNSSAFRMAPEVPLVVPEVNGAVLAGHGGLNGSGGIIANPNCVAAIMTVALAPLNRVHPIRRIQAATYQAASGGGAAMMEELRAGTAAALDGREYTPAILPHPYAFNLFSHNAEVDPRSGYNGEELKVIAETRRILGAPGLPIGITCIRVPVLRAHAIALTLVFDAPVSVSETRAMLSAAPGLRILDDREANHFPMPSEVSGQDDVFVGRIRTDLGDPTGCSLSLFVVGDQLRKGAALNAVQIAETLVGG
ncbi:aspartate-semialdehyde dehydrogenase [Defluviimonas sp. 20V17]|uniref:Aspartate-semialdehyde dehydrogenase n=1 Tax=Allgaiera indica TaxID=765699 RepID=A0AAN4UNE1_9RHOB|nr:aspartate-semialdehyde dehydrogenase [Allgaiera indica]KDB05710.1 aspartate-semialdehyde dehydrogenase [Defluviimonas sp. 20V17]GHD98978.1 aspartate-semialdehyde dehydrogenase [Allgaiera indica]SDW02380.1 aspartate semialdehyde dehydrogenase [Allgaiera indica]